MLEACRIFLIERDGLCGVELGPEMQTERMVLPDVFFFKTLRKGAPFSVFGITHHPAIGFHSPFILETLRAVINQENDMLSGALSFPFPRVRRIAETPLSYGRVAQDCRTTSYHNREDKDGVKRICPLGSRAGGCVAAKKDSKALSLPWTLRHGLVHSRAAALPAIFGY